MSLDRYVQNKNLIIRLNRHYFWGFFLDTDDNLINNYEFSLRNERMMTAFCGYRFDPTSLTEMLYDPRGCPHCIQARDATLAINLELELLSGVKITSIGGDRQDVVSQDPRWQYSMRNGKGNRIIVMSRYSDPEGKLDGLEKMWDDIGMFKNRAKAMTFLKALRAEG